jgi:hypothetical protein
LRFGNLRSPITNLDLQLQKERSLFYHTFMIIDFANFSL